MDNLRAFVIVLVVIYHVTMLYTGVMDGLFVKNPVPDQYKMIFMILNVIISAPLLNSIMFFIAGYFTFVSYMKKGSLKFIKEKLIKLDIPYLVLLTTFAPLTEYISARSWGSDKNLARFWFDFFKPEIIAPQHLWFIAVLLFFFFISLPILSFLKKKQIKIETQKPKTRIPILLLFLLVTFILYYCMNQFYESYSFVSIYITNFPPVLLPIYAFYFALGIYASIRKWFSGDNAELVYPWVVAYAVGNVLFLGVIGAGIDPLKSHPLIAFAHSFCILSGVMLLMVVFKKSFNKTSSKTTWVVKNSYGAYLIHYLIVFAFVYFMRNVPVLFIVKYFIQIIICPCIVWIISALLKRYTPLKIIL
jgi:hypothetical protein